VAVQIVGNSTVAGAVPTAPAPVGEDDHRVGTVRDREVTRQTDTHGGDHDLVVTESTADR